MNARVPEIIVEQRAKREDVAALVGLAPLELFGSHVLIGADDAAGPGQGRGHRRSGTQSRATNRWMQLREAEVEQLRTALGQHHVARLQVAVNDALAMRLVERVGDLDAGLERLRDPQRALLETLRERFTFEVLHDQEISSVLMPDVIERADVRVVQAGDSLRFEFQPRAQRRIRRDLRGQDFDRDRSAKTRIGRLVDLTHPPSSHAIDDLIRTEPRAGRERHRCGFYRLTGFPYTSIRPTFT